MTLIDKVHNIFMGFKGRSPRRIYTDACTEFSAKQNSYLRDKLSDVVDDFYSLEDLDLSQNYFGPKGCLAVMKVVQCQQQLKSLNLTGCGLDDIVVAELVEVVQDHPRLREVVLRDNPNISVFSAKNLARLVKINTNLVVLDLFETHVGRSVASVLQKRCADNRAAMDDYFRDDFFRLKDMFVGLDVDGSGWINIKNLIGSVVFLLVREKLEERIATMKPKKRSDNCIDVTTFMELTYLNFKTKDEIIAHSENSRDALYDTIVGNWASLLKALRVMKGRCSEIGKVAVRDWVLNDTQAVAAVSEAIENQKQWCENTGNIIGNPVNVSAVILMNALKRQPRTQVPIVLPKRKRSFLSDVTAKSHNLPPSLARVVLDAFDAAPPQGVTAAALLSMNFETEMERLDLEPLRDEFKRFSLPLDLTYITMVEAYNVLDEFYCIIRVPKPLPEEAVLSLVDVEA